MVDAASSHAEPHRAEDARWMRRALALARQSKPVSSPNPAVGCVLVRNGAVVGEGFHDYDRKDHAEIVALKQAGSDARGATAYVTLEPCSHTGRTGPCVDALISAGVARVVAATADPNPQVNGMGLERLRATGIAVECGQCEEDARELNDAFAGFICTGRPFVTLKAGVSLDGRIAPASHASRRKEPYFITGPESLADVQRMRHEHDALLTGINTVLADDPQLTDRTGLPRRRPLMRVVLDAELRLPLESKLVRTANEDVLVFCAQAPEPRIAALEARGVRVESLPGSVPGHLPFKGVLSRLAELQMISVMIEAGGRIAASALREECGDKLVLYYAPVILGSSGVPLVEQVELRQLHASRIATAQFGQDVRWTGYLHDPWNADAFAS